MMGSEKQKRKEKLGR